MERLTRWNDKTESAELTAYDDYDWEQFWNKEVLDIVDSLRLQPAFDMLAEYEDLEEQLESVYGEHSGLLETMVKSLVRHEGADFEKPCKARLLTDEDADKWELYKNLEEEGRLIVLPCKPGDVFWELNNVNGIPTIYPRYAHTISHCVYVLERLGKTAFLTEEDAIKALAEMRE